LSRFSGFLLLVLVALVGFQTWQMLQFRTELQKAAGAAREAVAAVTESHPAPAKADVKQARARLMDAAKAADKGDVNAARKATREAYGLLDPGGAARLDAQPVLKDIEKTRKLVEEKLKLLYRPAKEEKKK